MFVTSWVSFTSDCHIPTEHQDTVADKNSADQGRGSVGRDCTFVRSILDTII